MMLKYGDLLGPIHNDIYICGNKEDTMTPSEMPKIERLQMNKRVLKHLLDLKYKKLEDALQVTNHIRYTYFRVRRAYHFIDRELANIDGRLQLCKSSGLNRTRKTKDQEAIEDLSKEQLTELIGQLESLKEGMEDDYKTT